MKQREREQAVEEESKSEGKRVTIIDDLAASATQPEGLGADPTDSEGAKKKKKGKRSNKSKKKKTTWP